MINQITTDKPADATLNQAAKPQNFADRRSATWDLQNAVPNYLSLIFAQGGSAVFSFASVWLITRYLGSEGYGGVVAIIAASQIAQMLVNWTGFSVIRFGVDEFVETGSIARIFWLRVLILIPNIILVLATSGYWFPVLAQWLKLSTETVGLLFLHFVTAVLWLQMQFGFQGIKMPKMQGGLLTVERLLIFLGIVILILIGKLTPYNAVFCYAIVPFIMTLIGFWYLRNHILARFSVNWTILKDVFFYSFPLLPYSLIGYFSTGYIDAVFVSNFLSISDLGLYAVATQINGIALQLPTLANSLLIPLFITLQKETKTKKTLSYFSHVLPSLTFFWGVFCTLMACAGYFIIPLVFGKEFTATTYPLWILFSATTFSLPLMVGYSALSHATSTTYISMIGAFVSAFANIGFNFWLIPHFGMIGCAWATAISYFVSVLTFAVLLRREKLMFISWTFLAMLPTLGGALGFTLTGNPFYALFICLIMSLLIIFQQKSSILRAFELLKNSRKQA